MTLAETIISKGEEYRPPAYRTGEDPNDLGLGNSKVITRDVCEAWGM